MPPPILDYSLGMQIDEALIEQASSLAGAYEMSYVRNLVTIYRASTDHELVDQFRSELRRFVASKPLKRPTEFGQSIAALGASHNRHDGRRQNSG
jgi:hypothetical protein